MYNRDGDWFRFGNAQILGRFLDFSSLRESKVDASNRKFRAVVSPKITRAVGVDNSATWFVDGMIHRQRRK